MSRVLYLTVSFYKRISFTLASWLVTLIKPSFLSFSRRRESSEIRREATIFVSERYKWLDLSRVPLDSRQPKTVSGMTNPSSCAACRPTCQSKINPSYFLQACGVTQISPSSNTSFFQIGTRVLSVSMAYSQASKLALR